jgi:hypothetical protein
MTRPDLIRRRLIAGSALATLPMFRASPALAQVAKLSMGVGLAQEPGALMLKMQQDKLLEKAAQELGLAGVEAEYLNFPGAVANAARHRGRPAADGHARVDAHDTQPRRPRSDRAACDRRAAATSFRCRCRRGRRSRTWTT